MPSGPVVSNLGLGAHRKDVCKAPGGLLGLVQPPQGPREPHPHNPFVVSIHVIIPGSGRSPGEGSGIHSSILAWRIPWKEKSGGLQSIGSLRVRHD